MLICFATSAQVEEQPSLDYSGRWKVIRRCIANNCHDLPKNPCGEADEINLYFKTWPPKPDNLEEELVEPTRLIGQAGYRVCGFDPITFKSRMELNTCSQSILLDPMRENRWIIIGEGMELVCDVLVEGQVLMLHFIWDRYNRKRLDIREFYKKIKE